MILYVAVATELLQRYKRVISFGTGCYDGECVDYALANCNSSGKEKLETVCSVIMCDEKEKLLFTCARWNCACLNVRFEDLSMTR